MSVSPASSARRPSSTTQNVAGYLATAAIFIALIGITYRPVRIIPARGRARPGRRRHGHAEPCARDRRGGGHGRVVRAGMTAAVLTGHPLW